MRPDQLHAEAIELTGLSDFGPTGYREALDRLVHALTTEARLHARGLAEAHDTLRSALVHRLRLHERPCPAPAALHDPVVIVGPPRTGSTLLHRLLARHPGLHAVRLWELTHPVSPPGVTDAELIASTGRAVAAYYRAAPALRAIHPMSARAPEECEYLMTTDFHNSVLGLISYRVPSYADWLLEQDLTAAYRLHRLQLAHILARRPAPPGARLLLKSPSHLWHLPSLAAVYPRLTLVTLHRDPLRATASACSLALHARMKRSSYADPHEIGRQLHAALRLGSERLDAFPGVTVHVPYDGLATDPVTTATRVFTALGLPTPPQTLDRLRTEAGRRRTTQHRYAPGDFGLT
ncbi:sulfotransferase family protein [Streptomyces acidiscabies]|uniref:sulfotransferase family protein n=1 Tax=Streptomyces acidiscabies TaxID=42234 RepID=UPI000967C238|nr:sulfotransferase [Streptomyces acidiscabies]GAV40465.1 hypothetical protein Saa2_03355 [Streptomyces acidiscabies]